MKKLLVIGGSGLVGSTLIKFGVSNYEIFATYSTNKISSKNTKWFHVDLLKNRSDITNLIKKLKPNIIVHTAGHSNVDLCETDHKLADTLHIDVNKDIANISKEVKAKLFYLSTDAVFEGEIGKRYTEKDSSNPINYYGLTKLRAEKIILESSSNNVVLRPAVIYGWHKRSRFTNWILSYLTQKKIVDPFTDQYGTPTLVDDLVNAIIKIIEKDVSGLYHATGKTCLNRYDFALTLADTFNLDKSLIKPVTKLEKSQDAPRPMSTCLDSSKLEKLLNFNFCDIQSGVKFIYESYKKNPSLLPNQ